MMVYTRTTAGLLQEGWRRYSEEGMIGLREVRERGDCLRGSGSLVWMTMMKSWMEEGSSVSSTKRIPSHHRDGARSGPSAFMTGQVPESIRPGRGLGVELACVGVAKQLVVVKEAGGKDVSRRALRERLCGWRAVRT
ncbi:unnamed protein product [Sphagnum balticum]